MAFKNGGGIIMTDIMNKAKEILKTGDIMTLINSGFPFDNYNVDE